MRTIEVNGNKYIDQNLFDHINNIWANLDSTTVSNDSNIYFTKNTTVNRRITDHCQSNIKRVIKREKADFIVIKEFKLQNFPQHYDGVTIVEDDTKEPVYGVYNFSAEIQDTIDLICDFETTQQKVVYTNQDKLNESLNNGFVIDKESYTSIKELVDSVNSDNHELAMNMLIQSDLKANWEWILYIYQGKSSQFGYYDSKNIVVNYFNTLTLGYPLSTLLHNIDTALGVIQDPDVIFRYKCMVREMFQERIAEVLESIGTNKFEMNDFKLDLKQ